MLKLELERRKPYWQSERRERFNMVQKMIVKKYLKDLGQNRSESKRAIVRRIRAAIILRNRFDIFALPTLMESTSFMA